MRVYSVKGAQWISNPQIAEFDSPYPLQKENMFNILSLFKKEKWALVKSLKCINGTVVYHIHLFESSTGKRKAEFNRTVIRTTRLCVMDGLRHKIYTSYRCIVGYTVEWILISHVTIRYPKTIQQTI